jgi:hypothetical protein
MSEKKVLLVEGTDDEHVLKHLCGQRQVPVIDEIIPQGSIQRLLESFPVRLKESDIQVLGIVIDADTDIAARWNSVKDRLIAAGYPQVPEQPSPAGTILDSPHSSALPRFGVWIMPNNQTRGILEDFLRFLVPVDSNLFSHVQSCVARIPASEKRFSSFAEPKAIIHTWLAWQEYPGRPLGTAITARFLDANVVQVDVLIAWINRLFFP